MIRPLGLKFKYRVQRGFFDVVVLKTIIIGAVRQYKAVIIRQGDNARKKAQAV